jgi:5-methylthioribose kinase
MSYRALDEGSLLDYVRSRPEMSKVLPADGPLSVREVGDGNLNLVFIIESPDGRHSAVLKQALPYLRVAGASWPLTRERMRFESAALLKHNELAPGRVPAVYDYDDEMSAVLMEFLGAHEIMRRPLVERKRFPLFVDHITDFLSHSLFFTSDLYLMGIEKKALQARFINPHLCKIQEDFVFTNPYMESPENKWNPLLEAEVKETYMTHAQALIHSDLHTGSIMVNDTDTKVIDPEFAFFGPMGYDVGALLANFIINYVSHFAHTPDPGQRRALFSDTVGHGGCKILRRMMGIVSVWDLSSIKELEKRALSERLAIRIGTRWLLERSEIRSIDDMIGIVIEETAAR